MKIILTAMIGQDTGRNDEYEMKETSVCEFGEQWDGDIDGYIYNLYGEDLKFSADESDLYNVQQNFGQYEPIPGTIRILIENGTPVTMYWAADIAEEEAPFDENSFGDELPDNWEEIAEYLNGVYNRGKGSKTPNEIWEAYWQGEYTDAPQATEE